MRIALFALRVYKAYFSILFAGSCRYEPTCSCYAYEAVERFGMARGAWLAIMRLLRCHPLSRRFGYDPVPETWRDMQPTLSFLVSAQRSTAAADRCVAAQQQERSASARKINEVHS